MSTTSGHILISGSPMDGFTFTGPFPDLHAAEKHAATFDYTDWYVGVIEAPEDVSEYGDPDEYEVQYNIPVTATIRANSSRPMDFTVVSVETFMDGMNLAPGQQDVPPEVIEAANPAVTPWPEWTIR